MAIWVKALAKFLSRYLSRLVGLGILLFLYLGVQGTAFADAGAIAPLESTTGDNLSGTVRFIPIPDGMRVNAQVTDAPSGFHGFHIHEKPSCANGGKGAGGHFNPDGTPHGRLASDGYDKAHAGDMGNLFVNLDGTGEYEQIFPGMTLNQDNHAIANHAVILHAKIDSYVQPTGNAGARIGCGVIEMTQ